MIKAGADFKYRRLGLRKVEGWLDPYSADFIANLAAIQRENGWQGALGEIGIHHGKLFILLVLNATKDEKAFAIDVFENQWLNVDGSGCGNRQIFMANLARWQNDIDNITIIAKSSLEVRPNDITEAVGPVRLASIDGGHTEDCTFNDLCLIEQTLAAYGVIIVDDYFNPNWPDVSVGVARYLAKRPMVLIPFAISPNKVYLARPDFALSYQEAINKTWMTKATPLGKESVFFGHKIHIYGCGDPNRTLGWHLKEFAKSSWIGPYILIAKASIADRIKSRSRI